MYSFKFGGKNGRAQNLEESNNRVVVRTRNARKLNDAVFSEDGKKILEDLVPEMEFPESDVTILRPREGFRGDEGALRDLGREVLKNEEELRFAGRVLMDPETKAPVFTRKTFL